MTFSSGCVRRCAATETTTASSERHHYQVIGKIQSATQSMSY